MSEEKIMSVTTGGATVFHQVAGRGHEGIIRRIARKLSPANLEQCLAVANGQVLELKCMQIVHLRNTLCDVLILLTQCMFGRRISCGSLFVSCHDVQWSVCPSMHDTAFVPCTGSLGEGHRSRQQPPAAAGVGRGGRAAVHGAAAGC